MQQVCERCGGAGVVAMELDGRMVAAPCTCVHERRTERLLRRANIPARYQDCILESYSTGFTADQSLKRALMISSLFVFEYPISSGGTLPG